MSLTFELSFRYSLNGIIFKLINKCEIFIFRKRQKQFFHPGKDRSRPIITDPYFPSNP